MSFNLLITPDPPPAGNTGSPGDGSDCSSCHADFSVNAGPGTATITSNIPACGYVPLSTYSITVTVSQNGVNEFQFQLSSQNVSGTYLGTLVPNAMTQFYGGKYISGTLASLGNPNTNSWTFTWTAPAASTGAVTFYSAFAAVNSDADPGLDYIYTKSLTVPEAGSFSASTLATITCDSLCTSMATINATCGTAPYTYVWSTSPVQSTQTVTGLCAGTYTAVVADAVGTTITSMVTIPSILTSTMSSTDESATGNGTASASATGGASPYIYSWTPGGQTTATISGLAGGAYTVTITDTNGCTTTNTVVVNSTVGVVSVDNGNSISAYPNPSKGDFFIEINSLNSEEYTMNIMDVTGKMIYNETMQLTKGKNIRTISFATETEGVFFVQVKSKNGVMKIFPIAKLK